MEAIKRPQYEERERERERENEIAQERGRENYYHPSQKQKGSGLTSQDAAEPFYVTLRIHF